MDACGSGSPQRRVPTSLRRSNSRLRIYQRSLSYTLPDLRSSSELPSKERPVVRFWIHPPITLMAFDVSQSHCSQAVRAPSYSTYPSLQKMSSLEHVLTQQVDESHPITSP
jgi:hypothetical protein